MIDHFGKTIKALRLQRNLSQSQTVKLLAEEGYHILRPMLVHLEQGDQIPKGHIVIAFCRVFDVQPCDFYGCCKSRKPNSLSVREGLLIDIVRLDDHRAVLRFLIDNF